MQVPYIARYAATEAVWDILNGLGYSQKHNDRLVEEVEAVLDGYSVVDTQPVYVDKEYVLKCMEDSHKNAGLSTEAKAKITRWLNRAPAIYAQPIVRCANCKYDMTKKTLIEQLRNCSGNAAPCKNCELCNDPACSDTLMKLAADCIERMLEEDL